MSDPRTNLCVCPACNYDLRGAFDDQTADPTCPECGTHLRRSSPEKIYTRNKLHRQLRRQILAPTCLPPLVAAPLTAIPGTAGEIVIGLFSIIAFIGFPILFLMVIDNVISKARRHPRPVPRWTIPPLTMLYALPGIAVSVGLVIGFST